ncbi:hypothetical protein GQ53DRAFT_839568 [Thozetella sp. PMI_491]|nr:hypothetical protein GQ53DRAFT_839568 [Thozetella sp. PMI_491]
MKGFQFLGLLAATATASPLLARDSCKTIKVIAGDSCGSLATKCGISGEDFVKYNPSSTLCSTLAVDQIVCCSEGTLPDITPKPNADGTCAKYTVVAGDYCAAIAGANGLTVAQIEEYNANTPDWKGCAELWAGIEICLSTGPFSL